LIATDSMENPRKSLHLQKCVMKLCLHKCNEWRKCQKYPAERVLTRNGREVLQSSERVEISSLG